MAINPFPGWLPEVAADAIVVRPDGLIAEARGNQWGFGLDDEQRVAVTPTDAEGFIRAVAEARGRWLAEHRAGPMWFYCWHDPQAEQIRFSLVSAGRIRSLFACTVEPVSLLSAVVRDFLGGGESSRPLLVWVEVVPYDLRGRHRNFK
ncbi:hypothetical protein [Fimbriiglobus ruber]|uniref:hypothetical protein n=1 Tax=Fimbriiglobus ruber TaxID=1908690 RepID=UPI001179BC4B|nr:hypothetical protein [Fimbriiglobus ruber]